MPPREKYILSYMEEIDLSANGLGSETEHVEVELSSINGDDALAEAVEILREAEDYAKRLTSKTNMVRTITCAKLRRVFELGPVTTGKVSPKTAPLEHA